MEDGPSRGLRWGVGVGLVAALALALALAWPHLGSISLQEDIYTLRQIAAGRPQPMLPRALEFAVGIGPASALPWRWIALLAWWAAILLAWRVAARATGAPGFALVAALTLASFPQPAALVGELSGLAPILATVLLLVAVERFQSAGSPWGTFVPAALLLLLEPWFWPVLALALVALWRDRRSLGAGLIAAILFAWFLRPDRLPLELPLLEWYQLALGPEGGAAAEFDSSIGARLDHLKLDLALPMVLAVVGGFLATPFPRARRAWLACAAATAFAAVGFALVDRSRLPVGSSPVDLLALHGVLAVAWAAGMAPYGSGRALARWLSLGAGGVALAWVAWQRAQAGLEQNELHFARVAEQKAHRSRLAAALDGATASHEPVFYALFPSPTDRPIPRPYFLLDEPRPVWPLTPLGGHSANRRPYLMQPRDHLIWPFGESKRNVSQIPAAIEAGRTGGAEVVVRGDFPTARIEFVLYTEHGYASAQFGDWSAWPVLDPGGAGMSQRSFALEAVLRPLTDVLVYVRALGAERGYLEVRAVDDARGKINRPIAASRFLEVDLERLELRVD